MSTRPKSPLDAVMTTQGRRNDWLADQLRTAGLRCDEAQVSRWRSGKHVPVEATRVLIDRTLDTSVEWELPEEMAA